jgi:uncharacterized RDD family membrane protein YckC
MPIEQTRSSLPDQRPGEGPYPVAPGGRTDGVLGRRFFAYLIDLLVVLGLTLALGFAILILGVFTFGLAWWLFAILGPGTAILYSALTVGGPAQGTYGMRAMGLKAVDAGTGGPVDLLAAAVHALLFYVAAGTFVLLVLDVAVGAVRADRRLGHDLLVGVLLVRRA